MDGTVAVLPNELALAARATAEPAGWVEGTSLMWEADGISYTLGGASLSLDEAIRIAESLK